MVFALAYTVTNMWRTVNVKQHEPLLQSGPAWVATAFKDWPTDAPPVARLAYMVHHFVPLATGYLYDWADGNVLMLMAAVLALSVTLIFRVQVRRVPRGGA